MQIKNLAQKILAAFALFIATLAVQAGDIYSIDFITKAGSASPKYLPSPEYGSAVTERPSESNPLGVNDEIIIRVRMIDKDYGPSGTPWAFKPTSLLLPALLTYSTDVLQGSFLAPGLGLKLGTEVVYARWIGTVRLTGADDPKLPTSGNYYTDLYFSYTVKAGDIAWPALLMTTNDKKAASASGASEYYLERVDKLGLDYWTLESGGVQADFSLAASSSLPTTVKPTDYRGSYDGRTGKHMGLYINTVDFDNQWYDATTTPKVWRQVDDSQTEGTGKPDTPKLVMQDVSSETVTVYVWVDDDTLAEPAGAEDYDDGYGNRRIAKLVFGVGEKVKPFEIIGKNNKSGSANVCISATKSREKDDGGNIVVSWIERQINVVKSTPNVTFLLLGPDGNSTSTLKCTSDFKEKIGTLQIRVSPAPANPLTVTVNPSEDVFGVNPGVQTNLAISATTGADAWKNRDLTVTFNAGESKKELYLYGRGSTVNLEKADGGVTFTPTWTGTSSDVDKYTKTNSCFTTLMRATPVITAPLDGGTADDASLGDNYPVSLTVTGGYNDMYVAGQAVPGSWKVNYAFEKDGKWPKMTSVTNDSLDVVTGELKATIPRSAIKADATALKLSVTAPDGKTSSEIVLKLSVYEPARVVGALESADGTATGTYAEGEVAKVYFRVEGQASYSDSNPVYAFLKPTDDTLAVVTNCMSCDSFALTNQTTVGVEISPKEGVSSGWAEVRLLDGSTTGKKGRFTVDLCSTSSYDTKKILASFESSVQIAVTNVVPKIEAVLMGSNSARNGYVFEGDQSVPLGIEQKFRIRLSDLKEPSKIDIEDSKFKTQWYFGDSPTAGTDGWQDAGNGHPTNIVTHTFSNSGKVKVMVRCQDKDMDELTYSEPFEFWVTVDEECEVVITPRDLTKGNTYSETDTTEDKSAFDVSLVGVPFFTNSNDKLTIELSVVTNNPTAKYSTNDVVLSKYSIDFKSGIDGRSDKKHSFFLKTLDGTAASAAYGFTIKAKVKDGQKDSQGKKWSDGTCEIWVENRRPKILLPQEEMDSEGNAVVSDATIGQEIEIPWAVDDVDADKTNMVVVCKVDGKIVDQATTTNSVCNGTFKASFNSAGEKKAIVIAVNDKDDPGQTTVNLYYNIAAAKVLYTVSTGPAFGNANIDLSGFYARQAGRGEGHVYVKGGSFGSAENFKMLWNCGTEKDVTAYAFGYAVGAVDNGTLDNKYDVKITEDGGTASDTETKFYTYNPESGCDSYLYGWITAITPGESDYKMTLSPELRGSAKKTTISNQINLPSAKVEGGDDYLNTYAEAIFSSEMRPTDNMGDINGDGVPDYLAIFSYKNGQLASAGDGTSGSEIVDAGSANDDADYMPSDTQLNGSAAISGAGWEEYGQPFSAALEIRGAHQGLNFGMFKVNSLERQFGWVSDIDMSDAEKTALVEYAKADTANAALAAVVTNDAATAGISKWLKYPDNPADFTDPDTIAYTNYQAHAKAYIDATWAGYKAGGEVSTWGFTIENRTDPTTDDTDGDGISDGFEYYYWYAATVGFPNSGSVALTGEKFNLADIESPIAISSADIISLFNPTVAASVDWKKLDSDADGLYDFEEYAIGTNPVHWDTDKDGLSDLFEIMWNVNAFKGSGDSASNGASNTDGDYMAYKEGVAYYALVKLTADGKTYALTNTITNYWDANGITNFHLIAGFEVAAFNGAWIPTNSGFSPTDESGTTVLLWSDLGTGDANYTAVATSARIDLYHHQVYSYYGFDPRTGWFEPDRDLTDEYPNSAKFTAKDEYLLLKYRYITGLRTLDSTDPKNKGDLQKLAANETTLATIFKAGTTNPSAAFEEKTYGTDSASYVRTASEQHGADTDGDAVPDGWELYVGANPNVKDTGTDKTVATKLGLLAKEFAGTTSCAMYSGCPTIVANRPKAEGSIIYGWLNKFWPVDPGKDDTDGDGITDKDESAVSWSEKLIFGRWSQTKTSNIGGVSVYVSHRAQYGDVNDVEDEDDVRPSYNGCYAGGGFNPCSIDTDKDGLPDKWERQYAGVLFYRDDFDEDAFTAGSAIPDPEVDDEKRASIHAFYNPVSSWGYYVAMGMDPTVPDSQCDFDFDGLTSWQEYMVQALRHLRYDDCVHPLNGYDMPTVDEATGSIVPGDFTGKYLKLSLAKGYNEAEEGETEDDVKEREAVLAAISGMGYTNFVDFVNSSDGEDYLAVLGYFAKPPYDWDPANSVNGSTTTTTTSSSGTSTTTVNNGYRYMAPPRFAKLSATEVCDYTNKDGDGNEIWTGFENTLTLVGGVPVFTPTATPITFTNVAGSVAAPVGTFGSVMQFSALPASRVGGDFSRVYTNALLVVTNYLPVVGYTNYYYMLESPVVSSNVVSITWKPATKFVSTDPRLWDTDEDGLDDYWELFHGLNPLLGSATDGTDVIADAYITGISAVENAYTGWENLRNAPPYDPIKAPWLVGSADADADGDGLRNVEEGILVNLTQPSNTHTDPTPNWMTDTSVAYEEIPVVTEKVEKKTIYVDYLGITAPYTQSVTNTVTNSYVTAYLSPSYAAQFYVMPWTDNRNWLLDGYFLDFEENEGYDTDGDWRSDRTELTSGVEAASDPLSFSDPSTRQSVTFGDGGKEGVLLGFSPIERSNYVRNADFLKHFTVEAWVRPTSTGTKQYIISRAINKGGWDLFNTNSVIRLNFAIGITAGGNVFAEFDDSTDGTAYAEGSAISVGKWTHVAATYDGSILRVIINGFESGKAPTSLIPETGVKEILQDAARDSIESFPVDSYSCDPAVMAIGGRPVGKGAFGAETAAAATSWSDIATDFFKGSVDEVRVWHGVRTVDEIKNDFKVRYTTDKIKELRESNFASRYGELEIVHHYNFSTLSGATGADYVQQVPAGFATNVLATVSENVRDTNDAVKIGWWNAIVTNTLFAGQVYKSGYVVPWVKDTVGHLPNLLGDVADSEFWTEYLAGYTPVTFQSIEKFEFPNSMNPYSLVRGAKVSTSVVKTKYNVGNYSDGNLFSDLYAFGLFDARHSFTGTKDLIPLGDVYAKRLPEYWDGNGPEDAWAATSKAGEDDGDPDLDGIPNWATNCTTIAEYIVALAKGARPDSAGGVSDPYSTLMLDVNGNGIPDWWEKVYGIVDQGAYDDADNDGLSNYHEWWLSEGGVAEGFGQANGFPSLKPNKAQSLYSEGQRVPDYFLGTTNTVSQWYNVYLGFIATDHDFIENWWEKQYANGYSNASVYDPLNDWDENGWSNYAEARYQMWRGLYSADLIDGWNVDGTYHVDYSPEPALAIRSTYYGVQDLTSNTSHPQIPTIVTATRTSESAGRIDAKFIAVPSDVNSSDDGNACNQYLGPYRAGSVKHGFLSPGCVIPTTVLFYKSNVGNADYKFWKLVWQTGVSGPNWWAEGDSPSVTNHYSGSISSYSSFIQRYPTAQLEQAPLQWDLVASVVSDSQSRMGTIIHGSSGSKIGTIDLHSGEYSLDLVALAEVDSEPDQLSTCVFMVAYSSKIGNEWPQTIYYSNTKELDLSVEGNQRGVGRVMEGENTVTSLIDLDQSGDYTAGEPFGVISGVDVGWHKVPEQVVELRDTSHVVPRFDLMNLADDRTKVKGVAGLVTYTGNSLDTAAKVARIYIARTAINGEAAPNRTVLSKTYVLPDGGVNSHARTFIHEGDVLNGGRYDLDWNWLAKDAVRMGISDIKSATYEIGQHVDLPDGSVSNVVLATFVNTFSASRAVAVAESPLDGGTVFSAAPKFRWTSDDDTVTAFDLQVFDTSENLVYDSGVKLLPGRVDGAYEFNPWLYADAPVSTNGAPVFADGTNYFWRVAMLNAKYNTADSTDEAVWSDKTPFRMDLSHKELTTGYGSANAIVRYYGPCGRKAMITGTETNFVWGAGAVQNISSGSGLVIVEAFENADFHGRPMAQIRLSDYADLYSTTNITTVNATLRGLDPGTLYFRAYIDLNNNGKREEWEPWGYANHVDTEWQNANGVRGDWEEWGNSFHYDGTGKVYSEAIYDPLGVVVTDNPTIEKPTFVIYIEDCDVNRNNIPDSLEEIEDESDTDRDGLPDSKEDEYGADKTMWDTDGDGMPDGWEVLYGGTDPLQPDADEAVSGDVMAYTEAVLTVVTFKDDPSAYIVVGDSIPQVGDPASLYTYVSTYAYGDGLGVGTNVAVAATATIDSVNKRDVVLVHAQVYDEFGFNPNTANPNVGEAESVNTKPFTALDKYLVVRYLQNVYGLADEDAVNLGKKWSEYTLKTGEPDCNKDGVPDGWELYVMFGSGAPATTLTGVAISPWKSAADVRDTTVDADGDAHTIIEEYNRGVVPTDPWKVDTDGDGINDRLSHKYGLAGDRYNEDDDRDGLSNYQEYLISEVYKLFALDANNPYTFEATTGQLVSDYFLRHGSLYLGELFSDHDMIEDWWEDGMPSTISLGGTLRSNFSRWIYEADWDADRDGWNGWSTARAWFNELYVATNIVYESDDVAVTNYYITSAVDDNNGNPNPKVQIRVVYNDKNSNHPYIGSASDPHQFIVKVWSLENGRVDAGFGAPDCTWGGALKGESGVYELEGIASGYAASKGAIKPGRNMFVAYIAEGEWNEEGVTPAYVPNMPYGVAYDVEVGSISGANVNIELTDTNPSVARLDVYAILTAQAGNGTALTAGSDPAKKAFANLIPTYTDRGAYDSGALVMPQYIGNDTTLSSSNIHIRVLRAGINGLEQRQGYLSSSSVLIDRTMKVGVNHVLTEADLLVAMPSGTGDLDWGNLAFADSQFGGKANVTSATYRIVVGDGTVENTVKNNNLMIMFLNKFEALATQTPVSGMGRGTFAGRPTFSWKHENTIGKDYPAFQLRVWDGATVIYDSGVQRAPVRDQAGYYNWTPPLYIGAMLPNGKVFEPNKNYQWSVSMLDAKFTQPLANEEKVTFVVQETSPDPSAGDYGIIKVAVKYMGPGTVSTNTAANCIRVEAFTTPDFSGEPVGVGYVTDATTINSTTNLDINSKIVGLPQGDKYYVRAFLDTDVTSVEGGYGQRAPWESWGYASYRDPKEVRNDTFTPCPVAATNKDAAEPCVVFIEDCDTNRNMVPDIIETTAAGATTLYSPYIAYTASDAAKTNAVMAAMSGTNGDKNSVKRTRALLAYASATEAAESGTVTAGELAVLIGNVSFDTVDSANIRITSFSLDDGISLEVDVDGTFEGAVSAGYDTGLINVTVEYSKTLDNGGDWQRAGEVVTLSFSLTEPTTKIDASELVAIKDAIKAAKNNGGCYFRVSAVAFER